MQTNLVDMDSHYCSDKMLTTYGGQLMQIYYIFEDVVQKYKHYLKKYMEMKIANDDEDYFARPNNPRELFLPDHLLPFFMLYLKEMKNDCIEIMLHPKCAKFLKEKDCSPEELYNLSDEDAMTFKDLFVENKVSYAHKKASNNMDQLYTFAIDILTKKVPVESPNVKIDQILSKIVLIDMPEGIFHEDTIEKVMQPAEPPADGAEPPADGAEGPAM